MNITPVYGSHVFVVPTDGVTGKLSSATREELAVLLSVLSEPTFVPTERAAALNLTEKTFLDALSLWQRAGVLAVSDPEEIHSENTAEQTAVQTEAPPADVDETEAAVIVRQAKENGKAPRDGSCRITLRRIWRNIWMGTRTYAILSIAVRASAAKFSARPLSRLS